MVEGEGVSTALMKLGEQLICMAWNMELSRPSPKLVGIEYPLRGFSVSWKEVQPGAGTVYSMSDPSFPDDTP